MLKPEVLARMTTEPEAQHVVVEIIHPAGAAAVQLVQEIAASGGRWRQEARMGEIGLQAERSPGEVVRVLTVGHQ